MDVHDITWNNCTLLDRLAGLAGLARLVGLVGLVGLVCGTVTIVYDYAKIIGLGCRGDIENHVIW